MSFDGLDKMPIVRYNPESLPQPSSALCVTSALLVCRTRASLCLSAMKCRVALEIFPSLRKTDPSIGGMPKYLVPSCCPDCALAPRGSSEARVSLGHEILSAIS